MEPYRSYFPHAHLLLPETEELVKKVLVLPTGTAISLEDVDAICGLVRFAIENSEVVHGRLRSLSRDEEYGLAATEQVEAL